MVNFTNFSSCEGWLGYRLYSSLLHDTPFYNLRIVNEIRKQLQYLWLKSPLVVWELLAFHTWPNILLAFSTNSVQFVQVHACTQLIWIKWSEMMKQIHWIISLHAKWAHGLFFFNHICWYGWRWLLQTHWTLLIWFFSRIFKAEIFAKYIYNGRWIFSKKTRGAKNLWSRTSSLRIICLHNYYTYTNFIILRVIHYKKITN